MPSTSYATSSQRITLQKTPPRYTPMLWLSSPVSRLSIAPQIPQHASAKTKPLPPDLRWTNPISNSRISCTKNVTSNGKLTSAGNLRASPLFAVSSVCSCGTVAQYTRTCLCTLSRNSKDLLQKRPAQRRS